MVRTQSLSEVNLMHLSSRSATVAIAILLCLGTISGKAQQGATNAQKITALKNLRDSGVLSEQEYDQKIALLQGTSTPTSAHTSSSATGGTDAHSWHLKREERFAPLTDWQTHQSRNFKMVSMLLPVGWSMEPRPTETFTAIDCADISGRILLTAANPEKDTGIIVLPASTSMSSNNQAFVQQKQALMRNFKVVRCQIEPPISLAVNLRQGADKIFPGAQVVGQMEPVPGLSDQLASIVAGANRNGNSRITAEAGRIRVNANLQGKPSEMWIVALATHRTESLPGGGTVTYNDLPLLGVLFAPTGQLDRNDKLLMTLLSSVQIDPDWTRNAQFYVAALYEKINGAYAQVNRIHQQMAQDNANAAAQQQAIRNDTANYRSKVMSTVAANRSAALDHSSQQFALYMGDQAIYKDPTSGEKVQMSSQYGHVWASSTGNTSDFIMTDSPSYNPNGQAGSASWTQMEVVH
jgi:hypothetical protein